jgi:Zn-dependent protease
MKISYEENAPVLLFITLITLIVKVNLILALFNAMPIPPLDGSKVLNGVLPDKISNLYMRLEPYGMFVLLLLLFTVGFGFIFDTATFIQKHLYIFIKSFIDNIFFF